MDLLMIWDSKLHLPVNACSCACVTPAPLAPAVQLLYHFLLARLMSDADRALAERSL